MELRGQKFACIDWILALRKFNCLQKTKLCIALLYSSELRETLKVRRCCLLRTSIGWAGSQCKGCRISRLLKNGCFGKPTLENIEIFACFFLRKSLFQHPVRRIWGYTNLAAKLQLEGSVLGSFGHLLHVCTGNP